MSRIQNNKFAHLASDSDSDDDTQTPIKTSQIQPDIITHDMEIQNITESASFEPELESESESKIKSEDISDILPKQFYKEIRKPMRKDTKRRTFNISAHETDSQSQMTTTNKFVKSTRFDILSQMAPKSYETSHEQTTKPTDIDGSWSTIPYKRRSNRTFDMRDSASKTTDTDTEKSQNDTETPTTDGPKKKSFMTQQRKPHVSVIQLPAYYQLKNGDSEYEIPQNEGPWIKAIGGLEKSTDVPSLITGIIARAITYSESYAKNNTYFDKYKPKFVNGILVIDPLVVEEKVELILMQTLSIVVHRLIKSDSYHILESILKKSGNQTKLPLYRADTTNNNSKLSYNESQNAYNRLKTKFINDLKMSQNYKSSYTAEESERAAARIKATEDRWIKYVLQSIWNGNNPIHDCLYYGAAGSFETLLTHYYQNNMHVELKNMMLTPNIQNENHCEIVRNGREVYKDRTDRIVRDTHFNKCEKLYNNTINSLKEYTNSLVELESNAILTDVMSKDFIFNPADIVDQFNPPKSTEIAKPVDTHATDGDDINVFNLITSGDIESMIKYINRWESNIDMVRKTFELWQNIAENDESETYIDVLSDVKFHTKKLYDLAFIETTIEPNLDETTIEPNLDATTIEPNLDETTIEPHLDETTIEPHLDETTLEPNLDETTIEPHLDETTIEPNLDETTLEPNLDETSLDDSSPV